jgi:hypothetical protein
VIVSEPGYIALDSSLGRMEYIIAKYLYSATNLTLFPVSPCLPNLSLLHKTI